MDSATKGGPNLQQVRSKSAAIGYCKVPYRGSCPASGARPAGGGPGMEDPEEEADDWLTEAVDELIRQAAASAAEELR